LWDSHEPLLRFLFDIPYLQQAFDKLHVKFQTSILEEAIPILAHFLDGFV
jgi:hypothetical protein